MAGYLITITQQLQRFGRRPVLIISSAGQFVAVALAGFSWNFESYAFFLFLIGLISYVNYAVAFVLATETMGASRQMGMAIFFPFAYAVGYVISPLLGYLLPYWRWFLWSVALIGVPYIPVLWFCPESLRWLLASEREKEAKRLLKYISSVNGRKIDVGRIYEDFQIAKDEKNVLIEAKKSNVSTEFSYFRMLRNKTMLLRLSVVYLGWGISSMLYNAMTLNPSTLSGNRLINIFLSGLVEFPAFAFAYYLLRTIGRVRASVVFYLIAGVSCCIAPFLYEAAPAAVTIFVLIGKWSITGVFDSIYLVIVEISPTMVRTTSMGVASISARLPTIVMPYWMFAARIPFKLPLLRPKVQW